MDYNAAIIAMQNYFGTYWNEQTVILWGDDDNTDIPTDGSSWVRFNVRHSDGFQATAGAPSANRFERLGVITVQIFTQQGDRGVNARALADNALKAYEGVLNSDILYFDATVREIGNDGRGWHQTNVVTSFRYSEIT